MGIMSCVILRATNKTIKVLPPVVEFLTDMSYQLHPEKLSRLSAHLEELFSQVAGLTPGHLPPDLADEIAGTAGEIMVELADQRGDALAGGVIEDARRLREVVRSLRPEAAPVAEAGRVLVSDLELFIREDRRAA
jgi:hypothetical protein